MRYYRIAEMFGGVNVWQIGQIKSIGRKKFGEYISFSHKDTIYKLKFGKVWTTRQFPLYGMSGFCKSGHIKQI